MYASQDLSSEQTSSDLIERIGLRGAVPSKWMQLTDTTWLAQSIAQAKEENKVYNVFMSPSAWLGVCAA